MFPECSHRCCMRGFLDIRNPMIVPREAAVITNRGLHLASPRHSSRARSGLVTRLRGQGPKSAAADPLPMSGPLHHRLSFQPLQNHGHSDLTAWPHMQRRPSWNSDTWDLESNTCCPDAAEPVAAHASGRVPRELSCKLRLRYHPASSIEANPRLSKIVACLLHGG